MPTLLTSRVGPLLEQIIMGFYQIATSVGRMYEVDLPNDVEAFLQSLSIIVTLGAEKLAATPLECMGLAGYQPRLLFWMILPAALALVAVLAVVLLPMCSKKYDAGVGQGSALTARRNITEMRLIDRLGAARSGFAGPTELTFNQVGGAACGLSVRKGPPNIVGGSCEPPRGWRPLESQGYYT